MKIGMLVSSVVAVLFRVLFRRSMLTSKSSVALYAATYAPTFFLSRYLESIGTPKRDSTTGVLITSGEDLNQPGLIEYCFDVLYVTCKYFVQLCWYVSFDLEYRHQGFARLGVV
jgi:hypothetical protein